MVDLDAMVEASWHTFQQEYAATLGQLRAGEYLVASVFHGGEGIGVVPSVLAFPGADEIRLVVPGNDVLSCAYRLTRSELAMLRKLGLRRDEGRRAAYRLAISSDRVDEAASVATAALRTVFNVRHPAFLEGGGFAVEHRQNPEALAAEPLVGVYPEGPGHLDCLIIEVLELLGDTVPIPVQDGFFRVTEGPATVFVRSFACAPTVYAYAPLVRSIADRLAAQRLVASLGRKHPQLGFLLDDDSLIVSADMDAMPFDAFQLRLLIMHMLDVVLEQGPRLAARLGGLAFSE